MSHYDVIVVGGGPAGMMAAGTAAYYGKSVCLLEKNRLLGRKLRITGKGRCNITNNCDIETLMRHIPTNGKFLYSAFHQFSPADVMAFFERRGLSLKTERGNRVFPTSDQAAEVAEALAAYCREGGVCFRQAEVDKLLLKEGHCVGVSCKDGVTLSAQSVIVATGGLSYPLTGSTGDGYRFARKVGHTVCSPLPSLVPLAVREEWCKELQGLSLKNVTLTVTDQKTGKRLFEELGEMLFTHFGVSGPLVLSASAHLRPMEAERYTLAIDLKPGLDEKQLDNRLLRDFTQYQNRDFANALGGLLPRTLIPIVIMLSGISPEKKVNQLSRQERHGLMALLKGLPLTVTGFRPIEEAIITSGGIATAEINPKTMESKLCPGLYFAGEVLDVDGYTGGFNLQIAFSTGYLAGQNG